MRMILLSTQVIFLLFKIFGVIAWSWWLVFAPTLIVLLIVLPIPLFFVSLVALTWLEVASNKLRDLLRI